MTSAKLLSPNTILAFQLVLRVSRANRTSGLTDFREIRLLHLQSILDNGNTSVGNNTMNRTKSLVNLLESSLDLLGVSNITLPSLDFNTVLLCEIGCYVVGIFGRVEDDCYVCGSSGEGFGDCESDTCLLALLCEAE